MREKKVHIVWFRQDLRLQDNPAFTHAVYSGSVLPIYILDDCQAEGQRFGAASRCWLHHSLENLSQSLGGRLLYFCGDAHQLILSLVKKTQATSVAWNRCFEPWRIRQDTRIEQSLTKAGVEVHTFNGSLLWEPHEVLKSDGNPYKVFTPFYQRGCLNARNPRQPVAIPDKLKFASVSVRGVSLKSLSLLPSGYRWDRQVMSHWCVGEKAASECLKKFLACGLARYSVDRDFPSRNMTSVLSPYLHFGEISPHQIWHALPKGRNNKAVEAFRRQLAWREFSYSLLYANPTMPSINIQNKFDNFPWGNHKKKFSAWCHGNTGVPIIDAGMRQLWNTGFMPNRVRMLVGSFLVKNLLIDWRLGAAWFWDCLVDADLANNSFGWQWVAGCGADAAPYFRIFNPVAQAEKFDPCGEYIRHFVPELRDLPTRYLYSPWEASLGVLQAANVILGETYPFPIVNLKTSRLRALDALASIRRT